MWWSLFVALLTVLYVFTILKVNKKYSNNLHNLPGYPYVVEMQTGLHYRDYKIQNVVREITPSGS